ncbi:hypothetical protein ASG47_01805 [Devosia sp. Leaf420]|uniref:GNAT family N-acetyltransferase n=1 Tax=Devosia sp. Leaf420 TaxID=1736374 RepID=UPI0007141293|nr:GNAT family N-acetyltransferase [Devosia sp. Leaf420]KQT51645.1 hypothetical protein ASG47_01805 [Devosia sp. Leaf420]
MPITIRPARATDRDAIIGMHVEISRKAYGHILPDYYFAEVLPVEKDKLWSERFAGPVDPERLSIMVADADGALAGFTSVVFDPNEKWGAYLHHLYVGSEFQRQGLARRLWLAILDTFPASFQDAPISLLALEGNMPARTLYERVGGRVEERILAQYPGSPDTPVLRYTWPHRDVLRQRLAPHTA